MGIISVLGFFWPVLLVGIVVLVAVGFLMKFLLQKCNASYQEYETHTVDSFKEYWSIPQLMMNLCIWPRNTIKEGKITCYSDESYSIWLYGGGTFISLAIGFCNGGYPSIMDFITAVIAVPITIAISKWIYVGGATIMFHYVAGIKLSYDEGKNVFGPLFMLQYIINIVLSIIALVFGLFTGGVSTASSLSGYGLNLQSLVLVIWGSIMQYLLMKYRYGLSGKTSVGKIILIDLVWLGLFVLLGILFAIVVGILMKPFMPDLSYL